MLSRNDRLIYGVTDDLGRACFDGVVLGEGTNSDWREFKEKMKQGNRNREYRHLLFFNKFAVKGSREVEW